MARSRNVFLTGDGSDGRQEMLAAVRVSSSLFPVLGIEPMLGPSFFADEGCPGETDVAILSYGFWRRQFGSDPAVVGRSVPLDGRNHLVVGVMPPDFDFPTNLRLAAEPPDVWIPVVPDTVARMERLDPCDPGRPE